MAQRTDPAADEEFCVRFTDTDGDQDVFTLRNGFLYLKPGSAEPVGVDKLVWQVKRRRGTKDTKDRAPHFRVGGWRMTPKAEKGGEEWTDMMRRLGHLCAAAGIPADLPLVPSTESADPGAVRRRLLGPLQTAGGSPAPVGELDGRHAALYFWDHSSERGRQLSAELAAITRDGASKGALGVVAVSGKGDLGPSGGGWLRPADPARAALSQLAAARLGRSPGAAGADLVILNPAGAVTEPHGLLRAAAGAGWEGGAVGDLSVSPSCRGAHMGQCKAVIVLCDGCTAQVSRRVAEHLAPLAAAARAPVPRDPIAPDQPPLPPLLHFATALSGPRQGLLRGLREAAAGSSRALAREWTARSLRRWCAAAGPRVAAADGTPLLLFVDARDSEQERYAVSDATVLTSEVISDFAARCDRGDVEWRSFDFAAFEGIRGPQEEPRPSVPERGYSDTLGGVSWGGFGQGELGAAGGDSSSSSSSDEGAGDAAQNMQLLRSYKQAAGVEPAPKAARVTTVLDDASPQELLKTVRELEATVAAHERTIERLTEKVRKLEAAQGDAAPPACWRNEDDDSEGGEGAASVPAAAPKAKHSAAAAAAPAAAAAAELVPASRGGYVKKAPEVPKAQDDDWNCGSCFGFNWDNTFTCSHCGWVDAERKARIEAAPAAAPQADSAAAEKKSEWRNEDDDDDEEGNGGGSSSSDDAGPRAGGGAAGHSSLLAQLGGGGIPGIDDD
eukprot:TRINITY_DN29049_c1_g1_i1.p1 TRINITY_DN29049_c1_g1~~TRINITY_DN29049_c1_g1_i1.p1  ORF type:complete len:754 (+),score=158.54 TRINITY_DN29049_c1_g1_i1:79-2262(+)